MSKVLFLFGLGLVVFYWWRSQQIKDQAYQECLKLCYKNDVELLDGALALSRQWLGKDKRQRWHWFRRYEFEFTSTREYRYRGWVQMAGFHLVDIHMEAFHIN